MEKKIFDLTGPVLKKSKGVWYFEFWVVYANNVRIRKKISAGINYGKTDTEKQQLADQWLKQFPGNFYRSLKDDQEYPVHPAVRKFLSEKSEDWKDRTKRTYRNRLEVFVTWWNEIHFKLDLQKASHTDAVNFMHYLRKERGAGNTTWNCYRAILKEMFDHWKIRNNPFNDIKIFPDTKIPKRKFTDEERHMLWKHAEQFDEAMAIYIGLIAYCFIRPPNEIKNLRIGDIDFRERVISISTFISKVNRRRKHRIPTIFFPKLAHLEMLPAEWFVLGKNFLPGPEPATIKYYLQRMRNYLDQFNFSKQYYSAYSFRHTGAVAFFSKHQNIFLLQQAMRHSSVVTTEKYMKNWDPMDDPRIIDREEM